MNEVKVISLLLPTIPFILSELGRKMKYKACLWETLRIHFINGNINNKCISLTELFFFICIKDSLHQAKKNNNRKETDVLGQFYL